MIDARTRRLRATLALSSALGASLAVAAAPAAAQQQGSFGTVTGTQQSDTIVPGVQQPAPTFNVRAEDAGVGVAERLDVDLNARNTVITWSSFNVPAGSTPTLTKVVSFNNGLLSGTGAKAVLNRVTGASATQINGIVSTGTRQINNSVTPGATNIQVWVVNGNGIMVGPGANINTGGLVLSALNITDAEAFRTASAGGPYAVNFANAATSPSAITAGAGALTQINTNNGVLALIAPQITTAANVQADAGTGQAAFVLASDVNFTTSPGGPLSITINAGTRVVNDQTIAGAVVGNAVYMLLKPQDSFATLLNVPASITNADVDARGVVVLSGGGLSATVGSGGNADTLSTGAASANATTSGVAVTGPIAFTAGSPGNGIVRLDAALGTASAGAIATGGDIRIGNAVAGTATGTAALTGSALTSGNLTVTGGSVTLGAGATPATQTIGRSILLDATAGAVSIGSGVTLTGDAAGTAAATFQVGGAATTALNLAGSTLIANPAATAGIRFTTASAANPFAIGNVQARLLTGAIGATVTPGVITRTGTTSFGNLTLTGPGAVLIDASGAATDQLDLGNLSVAAGLTLRGGAGGVSFGTFGGAGANTVASAGSITGTSIDGTGAVQLTAGTTAADAISFTGGIGATTPPTSVLIDAGGAVTINSANAPIGLGSAGAVTIGSTTRGATLSIGGATSVTGAFTARTSGSQQYGGGIGAATAVLDAATTGAISGTGLTAGTIDIDALTATFTGALTANAPGAGALDVTTNGTQSAGAIASSGSVNLVATNGGDVRFASVVAAGNVVVRGAGVGGSSATAGFADVISSGGSALVQGAGALRLGTVTGATSVSVEGGSYDQAVTTIANGGNAQLVSVGAGSQAKSAGGSATGDFIVTGVGGAQVSGNATARGAVTLTASAGLVGIGSGVTVTSDSDNLGGELLTVGGAGTTALALTGSTLQAGGNGTGIVRFGTATAGDPFEIGNVVAGTLQQTVASGVAVAGISRTNVAAINTSFGNLTLSGSNAIATNTALVTGAVTLTGAGAKTVTLTGDAGVTTGALANVNGAVGTVTIDADAGAGAARVAASALDGTLTVAAGTGGAVLGTLAGTGAKLVTSTGSIAGAGTNGSGFATSGTGAVDLEAAAAGTITVDTISATGPAATSLTINGAIQATVNGAVNVATATRIGQASDGAATGALAVAGALTTGSLTATTTGNAAFGAVTTAATPAGTVSVTSGGGAITFGGALNGGGTLATSAPGLTTFGGPVGTTTPFLSLTTTGPGAIAINGGAVTTVGDQTYGGAVALGGAAGQAAVLTGNAGLFASGITGNDHDLTLTFTALGTLPAIAGVRNLLVDGGGTTSLGGAVTTSGTQSYADTLVLLADVALTSTGTGAAGDITIAGIGGGKALTVNTAGTTRFGAGTTNLPSITTDAGGVTELNGTISTTAFQRYGDAVRLASNVAVASTGNDAITFGGTVQGPFSLGVTTAGVTRFGGAVGATLAGGAADPALSPTSLTVGSGAVQLDGGAVTTSGAQTYGGALRLGADAVLTGTTGTFTGAIGGNGHALTLNFSGATAISGASFSGVTDFESGGGGTTTLTGLVQTSGRQTYRDAVTLGGDTELRSTGAGAGGDIALLDTVTGARALTITTGGTTTLGGAVTGLTSLQTDAPGATLIGGGTVTTSGAQTYGDAVTLGADTALTARGLTFGASIGKAATLLTPLTLTVTTGAAAFGGAVGTAGAAIDNLSLTAGSATFAATNRVGTLAAAINAGGLSFANGEALTIGTVGAVAGVNTGGAATTIAAAGLLIQAANVTAGTTTLTGTGITQNSGTSVTAAGPLTLDGNDGAITLAGTLTAAAGGANALRIIDAGNVLLGNVSATGAGAVVTLGLAGGDSIAGTLTQGAGMTLVAATLTGNVGGLATLANGGNSLDTLGAFGANGLSLREANGLTVTGPVNAGTGALSLQLDAGSLALQGTLAAGDLVTLVVPGTITQAAASGITAPRLTGSSRGGATLTAAGNAVVTLAGFTNTAVGGFALTNAVPLTITGALAAGQTLAIAAPGIAFAGQTLSAATTVTLDGRTGAVSGGVATAGTDLTVTGASAALTTATATAGALAVTATTGPLSLGTGLAGTTARLSAAGDLTVATSLRSGGTSTLTATGGGNAQLTQVRATSGDILITAAGGVAGPGGTRADLAATGNGGDVRVQAGGAARLGPVAANDVVDLQAGSLDLTTATGTSLGLRATAGALRLVTGTATAGAAALSATGSLDITTSLTATGDVTIDSGGLASLAQVTAGTTSAIAIRALDAAITGTQRAARVSFINRAPATVALRLGDATTAGGFTLSQAEVNNVEAGQLTFDGGSGTIEVGALAFDADAGRTRVDLLGTGRIDVTGTVTGTGAGRAFRFGGTAAGAADRAAVIRVVATPDAGGRLLFDTADLELRGARIGVGLARGFLDPIGFGAANGLSPNAVAGRYLASPNSSLYSAAFGGQVYSVNTTLVSANSLTVRYTDYALFQNSAPAGLNAGVVIGSTGAGALTIAGPGRGANGFALFGSIGGVTGTSAALLGSQVIVVSATDLANTRLNGCLVGSGAGCLTSVVAQPMLSVFDASRADVFRTADDLALPFDPVIGTNNEALFSGAGLLDLDSTAPTGTECAADTTSPGCGQKQEQGK